MRAISLRRIWLTPPLAFARLGSSKTPCSAFSWGPNDLAPDGTGSTTLQAADTLDLDESGTVSLSRPERIVFRDEEGIRPVCPFFELHGDWTKDGVAHSGPVTVTLLGQLGIGVGQISWDVHVASLKSFDYTFEPGDRIDAILRLAGTDTKRHVLEGRSPKGTKQPLVPADAFVPLGAVQIAQPSKPFPEIRLRFYAPPGHTFGPTNLARRIEHADRKLVDNREWADLRIPPERQILNPKSKWATFVLERSKLGPFFGSDVRHAPWNMFATLLVGANADIAQNHALGLVDDTSDGVITCSVKLRGRTLSAFARVVVGPPDFAPANRPPVSLADNLTDRTDRAAFRGGKWTMSELREMVGDIFERAYETSSLSNKDAQNMRVHDDNLARLRDMGMTSPFDRDEVEAMLWPNIFADLDAIREGRADPLVLAKEGVRKHRRYLAIEYVEERFRENPELFHQWIRRPLDPNPFYDQRMPALMKGPDSRPYHLTRRQWEAVRLWVQRLQQEAPAPVVRQHGNIVAARE
jgi:hypothetical protein